MKQVAVIVLLIKKIIFGEKQDSLTFQQLQVLMHNIYLITCCAFNFKEKKV